MNNIYFLLVKFIKTALKTLTNEDILTTIDNSSDKQTFLYNFNNFCRIQKNK